MYRQDAVGVVLLDLHPAGARVDVDEGQALGRGEAHPLGALEEPQVGRVDRDQRERRVGLDPDGPGPEAQVGDELVRARSEDLEQPRVDDGRPLLGVGQELRQFLRGGVHLLQQVREVRQRRGLVARSPQGVHQLRALVDLLQRDVRRGLLLLECLVDPLDQVADLLLLLLGEVRARRGRSRLGLGGVCRWRCRGRRGCRFCRWLRWFLRLLGLAPAGRPHLLPGLPLLDIGGGGARGGPPRRPGPGPYGWRARTFRPSPAYRPAARAAGPGPPASPGPPPGRRW